jgi:hypothetical protein
MSEATVRDVRRLPGPENEDWVERALIVTLCGRRAAAASAHACSIKHTLVQTNRQI